MPGLIRFIPSSTGPSGSTVGIGLSSIVGPTGPVGPQGFQGLIGPTGVQGNIGPTGDIGPQGSIGQGFRIFATTNSFNNLCSTNPTGSNIGEFVLITGGALYLYAGSGVGSTGPAGCPTEWIYSGDVTDETLLIGPQGDIGPTGSDGVQGPQGEVGPTGADGVQGPQGDIGPTGADGVQGPQGDIGPTGAVYEGPYDSITVGNLYVLTGAYINSIIGNSSIPSIIALTGAGVNSSVSLTGTDVAGSIYLTCGTGCNDVDIICSLTFSSPYTIIPYPVISPANENSAMLTGNSSVWVNASTTTMDILSGQTPLTDESVYKWNYHVIG